MVRIVISDDNPPVIIGTAALKRIQSVGDTVVFKLRRPRKMI